MTHRRKANRGESRDWVHEHANYAGDDCLIWPFSRSSRGYGQVYVERKQIVASRYMCIVAHGEPPKPDYQAAHSCGNGHLGCMNPRHLSWKSHAGNVADAIAHGRTARGSKNPSSKLSEADVLKIKRSDSSPQKLADEFCVHPDTVRRIRNGKHWSWLNSQGL